MIKLIFGKQEKFATTGETSDHMIMWADYETSCLKKFIIYLTHYQTTKF